MGYEYTFVSGALCSGELVQELATLYSNHYGVWSPSSPDAPRKRVPIYRITFQWDSRFGLSALFTDNAEVTAPGQV